MTVSTAPSARVTVTLPHAVPLMVMVPDRRTSALFAVDVSGPPRTVDEQLGVGEPDGRSPTVGPNMAA